MEKSNSWKVVQQTQKMYCMNNVVIVDHHGLFIYIDSSYPSSFHDITCLCASQLHRTWREHFAHNDEDQYFKYILGDSGYVGPEMFIMWRIQRHKIGERISQEVIDAMNKMHVGYRIQIEWGIGGLKQKWQRFMKRFDNQCPRFCHFFDATAKLTNFFYQRHMIFDKVLLEDQEENEENYGWVGIFD